MSVKRSDIEVIDDDDLVELVDDDGDGPTTVAPSPQPHGHHRRATAPLVSLEPPSHRKPTQPLFTTDAASLPEPLPRASRQRPVVAPTPAPAPAPYYPSQPMAAPGQYPQSVSAPFPEPAYPQPVSAPYPEPYHEPGGPITWDTEPRQESWAGPSQSVEAPSWAPEQQPLPPMGSTRPRVALHPAALFGMVVGALAIGVGLAVVLLKPSTPQPTASAPTTSPELVKPVAPVTVPLPTPPIPAPTAAATPRATVHVDLPARPAPTTTSGVRARAPSTPDLTETVAARLAAAQPEATGGTRKPAAATEKRAAPAAEPSEEPAAVAKPEKKHARSADPFADEDSSTAAPEPKPEKKAKKWEDPFAAGE